MSPSDLKAALLPLRSALASYEPDAVRNTLAQTFAPDATLHLCHPFGDLTGATAWQEHALAPLHRALPDLERRDLLLMAGQTASGDSWVGAMGNYMGTFLAPFLDIPPTGQLAHMRYHEFFRLEAGQVTEMQAIWDLPELMMQAGAWPLAPQLGAFLCTPAPMTGDGHLVNGDGSAAIAQVEAMLAALGRHPADPDPAVMELHRFWHPRVNWYGPAGIGTARGIAGFRHWHQIPFLRGMPDRGLDDAVALESHWIGEGDYVCETGWPNMRMTLTGDGWLGLPPASQPFELRSLDFWRLEGNLIRENWVLIDLLDMYRQLGVDVLGRMQQFNKARSLSPIALTDGLERP